MKPGYQYPVPRRGRFLALTCSVSLCSVSAVRADLLAYEGFNYTVGGEVENGAGGSGWAAAWIQQATQAGTETINDGSMITASPGFNAASTGNSATLNAGHRVARLLDVSPAGPFGTHGYLDGSGNIGADGTTLYLSFVISETNGNASGYFEFVFNRDNLGDSGRIGGIGDNTSASDYNLRTASTHTRIIRRDTKVHRFVVRFDFLAGNDRVTVYPDPTSNVEPAAGDAQVTLSNMSFDGLSFAAFGNANVINVDEIRIATTYAEAAIAGVPQWAGAAGPFSTAANWSPAAVPDDSDVTIANGGTAQIGTDDNLFLNRLFLGDYAGSGTLAMDDGFLSLTKISVGGTNALAGTGTGTLIMTAGEIYGVGNEEFWVGSCGGTGMLQMSGDALLSNSQQIHFGRDGGSGHATIGGTAILEATQVGVGLNSPGKTSEVTVKEGGTFRITGGNLSAGWLGGATTKGILNIQDTATVSVNGELRIGAEGGTGELHMTGGTLSVTGSSGYLPSGRNGGIGTVTISGDSTVTVNRFMMAGAVATGSGTITVDDDAQVTAERFTVAYEQNTSGVFTVNGGSLRATNATGTGVVLGGGGTGILRQLDLNGGVVAASGFAKKDGNLALDINFNGGTVQATMENANYFRAGSFDGSSLGIVAADLELKSGGLAFDTAGFSVGISQALAGPGGLTKTGAGVLTLSGACTYLGETMVLGGGLVLGHATLDDASTVRISGETSTLALAYEGTDTIANLVIDGVQQAPGLYRSAEGSGPGTVLPQLAGTGVLNVVGESPDDYAAWLAANAPATGFDTDSDGDGIPNGVEHVLGSDPNLSTPEFNVAALAGGSISFTHALNPQIARDVSYHYEWSTDLDDWKASGETNTAGASATIVASPPVEGIVTVTVTPAGNATGRIFSRLVADLDL